MISLKSLLLENLQINLTKEDAQEVLHKMVILSDSLDLQMDYGITQPECDELLNSIPHNGGVWNIPDNMIIAVKGEMEDHVQVMRDIARDAYNNNEKGQSLRINKQARRFEKMFGLLTESATSTKIVGSSAYWMDKYGKMIPVDGDHINWILQNLNHPFHTENGVIYDSNAKTVDRSLIYDIAFKLHYIRIRILFFKHSLEYDYAGINIKNPPNAIQMRELKDFSICHNLELINAVNGRQVELNESLSVLDELKVQHLNKSNEDIYFIAYKEHLFLVDENSDYKSLEPYFKDHPEFNDDKRNIFDNEDWYDFIGELAESAPDIMVGRYDPIQKILTLDGRGHFNARSSLILKKVVKQLKIKKIETDHLDYNGEEKQVTYNKNKILGDVPVIVFHGTTSNHIDDILKYGLRAGKGGSKFDKQDIWHETEIFFAATFDESKFYAYNAKSNSGGIPIIFEFTIPDKSLLKPDYDADTASTNRSDYYQNQPTPKFTSKSSMKPMGLSRETGKWGYSGRIPSKFIRWVYLYRHHDKKWIKLRPSTISKLENQRGSDWGYKYGFEL